ncbi:MAG: hypothetical protein U1F25_19070 [Rubrivivax sp.]
MSTTFALRCGGNGATAGARAVLAQPASEAATEPTSANSPGTAQAAANSS